MSSDYVYVVSQISCLSGTFLAQRELAHYQGTGTTWTTYCMLSELR